MCAYFVWYVKPPRVRNKSICTFCAVADAVPHVQPRGSIVPACGDVTANHDRRPASCFLAGRVPLSTRHSLRQHGAHRPRNVLNVGRLHCRHRHAAVAGEVDVVPLAQRVHVARAQPRVCKHADLVDDVAPIAAVGRGRALGAQRVRQQHAHAVHAVRHPAQLAAPLRKERRVAEYLGRKACAVQRRRRVGGAHNGLLDGAQHRLRLFARRAHEVDRANPLAV
mmetsp:Transcript_14709/g.47250  ORF Transcript_14709/g.47250 Transcript_14709/m.47250 type:complete len:223 (-) Transcript_14709:531-1199(-)